MFPIGYKIRGNELTIQPGNIGFLFQLVSGALHCWSDLMVVSIQTKDFYDFDDIFMPWLFQNHQTQLLKNGGNPGSDLSCFQLSHTPSRNISWHNVLTFSLCQVNKPL